MEGGRRLREYLRSLPEGLASYPTCQTKTTVALSALENHNPHELAEGVPEELATLILNPPPLGVWMPATYSDAVFQLVCDRYYPTEEKMMAWCDERTMAVAEHPLYKRLLRVSGPRVFFSIAARTHRMFQRGTDLELLRNESGRLRVKMSFPPHLHNRFNLLSNCALFRGAATLTGGQDAECRLLDFSPSHANYECTWR